MCPLTQTQRLCICSSERCSRILCKESHAISLIRNKVLVERARSNTMRQRKENIRPERDDLCAGIFHFLCSRSCSGANSTRCAARCTRPPISKRFVMWSDMLQRDWDLRLKSLRLRCPTRAESLLSFDYLIYYITHVNMPGGNTNANALGVLTSSMANRIMENPSLHRSSISRQQCVWLVRIPNRFLVRKPVHPSG